MGLQRVRHDWATFTFTFNVVSYMCSVSPLDFFSTPSFNCEDKSLMVLLHSGNTYLNRLGLLVGGSDSKASACNAEDPGSIPGLGRSPGEGNGNLLQYSCLENPMDGGAWWATVHVVTESDTAEGLHFHFLSPSRSFHKVKQLLFSPHLTHRKCGS